MMSSLYATIFWTEFQQKMKDDGIEVPEKLGVNATAYLRALFIRDCDPRKVMLNEIRCKIENSSTYKPALTTDDGVFVHAEVTEDEGKRSCHQFIS